jgi:dephospho-CoA kinase
MFGISIMDKKGIGISRAKLGNMVFSDSQRLKKLNEVVHPIIKSIVVRTIGSPRVKNKKVLIVGALIREIGLQAYCNKTAIIDASDEDIEREIGSRCRILEFQRSRDEYLRNADWVVVNEYNDDFYSDVAGLSLL